MEKEQRLIDANAAVELLRSLGSRDYRRENGTIADAIKMLSHPAYTPTVDAVEVVRCKECKKISPSVTPIKDAVWCREFRAYMPCDGFCSYGERRTDG